MVRRYSREPGNAMETQTLESPPKVAVTDLDATIDYMVPMAAKPARYLCEPPAGSPELNWQLESKRLTIRDGRACLDALSLDEQGFELHRLATQVTDFQDADLIRDVYYPEIERFVRGLTGAADVVVFDYNVRNASKDARQKTGAFPPGRFAHGDYTPTSAPKRIRELLATDAEQRLSRPYCFINVWRPIGRPVENDALAVCDARTIAATDLAPTDLIYADRVGEFFNLTHNPAHRWYYFRHMTPDEVLVFTNFDSRSRGGTKVVAHAAFTDPTASAAAPPRESIEARAIAFF